MTQRLPTEPPLSTLLGILNDTPNGVVAYQPIRDAAGAVTDYQTTYYNERARQLLGWSEADFAEKTLFERFPEGRQLAETYMPLMLNDTPFIQESFFEKAQCWLETQARKLDGGGFFLILRDITDRKQAEAAWKNSAAMLQTVLDGVQSGVASFLAVRDEHGQIIDFAFSSANQLGYALMQKTADEMSGGRLLFHFPHVYESGLFARYVTTVETGQQQQFEQQYHFDGLNRWFDVAAVKQGGDGLLLTFLDISERKKAQQELVAQANQLSAIFESSPNGIISMQALRNEQGVPTDFLIEAANPATLTMTGREPATLVGSKLHTMFPGNEEAGFLALYRRVLATGMPESATQYYHDEHGLEAWFQVSAVRQGQERIVVTFSDVTAAQQLQRQLRESNQSLEQFAAFASHDLQEPLRKVQAFGDVLVNEFGPQLGDTGQTLIGRMKSATERMSTLIQDLLAFSRIASQPETNHALDLTRLVDEVLTDLETRVAEKRAEITIETLPTINGNALAMRQLFQNLLTNALKFSHPDVPPRIQVNARQVNARNVPVALPAPKAALYWRVEVRDNGIGLDLQYKDRIFSAFQRLHAQNSPYGGTGIGLAIVKKVVDQHRGGIEVESVPGEGSAFMVYLPV